MGLSIFSRLIIGYFSLLLLITGVSAYSIAQLGRVTDITHSIISVDNSLIDIQKKLADALLSETRYEKKFLIMKDAKLYNGFLGATADFEQNLDEAMKLHNSTEIRDLLADIKQLHEDYKTLFDNEIEYLRSGKRSSKNQYAKEREKLTDGITEKLIKMKALGQDNIFAKIRNLGEAGDRSRRVALVSTTASLLFGIILSIFITRSITAPLSEMKKKTREIAAGNFEGNLNVPSAPEMGELASAFNVMCRKLKEVDKMKSDFYSLMSHELRTPLASIKEGTNLLREGSAGETTEKQARLLTIIAEESNRLIGLVNSLLDLSKMEAGMLTYNFSTAELAPLIQEVIFEMSPIAESKKIRFEKLIEKLPLIKMDQERILQVLRNLVGNALKFTPDEGLITISTRIVRDGAEVSVADTGAGIPKEHLDTIFDKFQQVGGAGSGKFKGTGLGLAIAKHIIDRHGGRIWVESNVGGGSTFSFVLPV